MSIAGGSASRNEEERPSPQNIEAERSILGAILLDNNVLNAAVEKIKAEDFFHDHHKCIFRQMLVLAELHQAIDLVTLTEQLQRDGELEPVGGAAYVSQLIDDVPHITNVEHYARIVREKARLRRLIYTMQTIKEQAYDAKDASDAILDLVEKSIVTLRLNSSAPWTEKFHMIEELPEGEPVMPIVGILPEGVTFLGGSSGAGKTWVALSMSRALTTGRKFLGVWDVPEKCNVLYLVPEMSARAFKKRAQRFGINGPRFRCMTIADGAALDLADGQLRAAIRDLKPVVFLDTAIRFSSAGDENSATDNAKGLAPSIFALLHGGAKSVVCLHHRSKEAVRADEMTLENVLRGSGDLGAIADAVYGLQCDRGDSSPSYIKESKKSVRLVVRCVKARDFMPHDDFRVQLDPFIDEIGDMSVVFADPEIQETDLQKLSRAIAEHPKATKVQLQTLTGVGRNRIEKIAQQDGWQYTPLHGWSKG